jgi:prefoldin subunit 5
MTGSRLIGIVVALAVLIGAAYFIFPGFRAKADALYEKHAGWNEEARRKDPAGFIRHSVETLDANIAKFETIKTDVRTGKATVEKLKTENEQRLAFNTKNLGEFKVAYKTAKESSKWPVDIAGRKYSEPELKSQVELLLSEKATFESVASQLDQSCKDLEAKEFELQNRITESRSKLSMLKNQEQMVKANALTAESEKLLAEVNDVLIRNDAMNAPVTVRTTEELMKEAKSSAVKATPKADDFLNS